jgi:hypothetical protein
VGSIPTASTIINSLPRRRALIFRIAKAIGLRPIGAFTQAGSLRDPSAFTLRRSPAVSIPTASTRLRFRPLVGTEACHGEAIGEAGHTLSRLYRVENYALASRINSAYVTHNTPNSPPLAESH